jgi:magnesium transporter
MVIKGNIEHALLLQKVAAVEEALEREDDTQVNLLIQSLHGADLADLVAFTSAEWQPSLVKIAQPFITVDVLVHLDDINRAVVLNYIDKNYLKTCVQSIESQKLFDIVEHLDTGHQLIVLKALPLEKQTLLAEIMAYPTDSAGRLMQSQSIGVPPLWSVNQVINHIAQLSKVPSVFYSLFVVNEEGQPVGEVLLSRLLGHPRHALIETVMNPTIYPVPVTMDQEEVAYLFRRYDLVSLPVINAEGKMVGVISIDDIVDVLHEEATEDILKLGRVTLANFNAPIYSLAYDRIRWLIVTFINTLIVSYVILQFEDSIKHTVALAILMPIVAAMGGNQGMQVVTLMVRAIAAQEIHAENSLKILFRELIIGCINGLFFAVILGCLTSYWFHYPMLGIILAAALLFNMMWASLAGTLMPLLFHRLGLDPAVSAGPLLTTTTDVLGFVTFLGLATLFLQ